MTYDDLIRSIYESLEETVTKTVIRQVLNEQLAVMRSCLKVGIVVRLPRFGQFSLQRRKGRKFYSVCSGKKHTVPTRNTVIFKLSPKFKEMLPDVPRKVVERDLEASRKRAGEQPEDLENGKVRSSGGSS